MATPNFQVQVESFLRRMGEGDITITYASHIPNNTLSRISFKAIYDYFYLSGLCLYRVLRRIVPLELKKHTPSFFFQETVSLAANVGAISTAYESLNDEASLTTIPPNGEISCKRFPVDLDRSILLSAEKGLVQPLQLLILRLFLLQLQFIL